MTYKNKYYLSVCLKNGEFYVLRKLIPETLFYSTNLPLIKVRLPNKKSPELEQPDIALTYLIPGRVTYRYGREGHIIPVKSPSDPTSPLLMFSLIIPKPKENEFKHSYHTYSYDLDRCESSPTRYVHELMYTLEKLNIPHNNIRCFELREVYPHTFRPWDLEDLESSKEFGKFAYSTKKGSMYDAVYYIRKQKPDYISQISSKTISYPRIGAFFGGVRDCLPYEQRDLYLPHLRVEYCKNIDLIRYVYAEDIKINYRKLEKPREEDLLKREPYKRYTRSLTKILLYRDAREGEAYPRKMKPSVIGYKVDKTSNLLFVFTKSSIEESLEKLLKTTKSWLDRKTVDSLGEFYVAFTVCQSLRNSLLYILTEDLYSSISRFEIGDQGVLKDLTRVALLYSELNEPLCQLLLRNKAEALEDLRNLLYSRLIELRDAARKLESPMEGKKKRCVKTKPYIITLLYKGKHVANSLGRLDLRDSDIAKYVENLITRLNDVTKKLSTSEEGEYWMLGLLRLIASHTYTHHVIKHISLSSGLTTEFLGEHIDLKDQGSIESFIYENASGGIAAIEGALASWGLLDNDHNDLPEDVKKQNRIESLLLRLGECTVGTPEDALYTHLLGIEDPTFMTPLESSEYQKLRKVFNEEVIRFSKIWNLNSESLSKEIMRLLHESDMKFMRFSNHDDVLLYYTLTRDKWSELGKLFTRVLSRALQKSEGDIENMLIDLHSYVGDSREENLDNLKNLSRVLSIMKSTLIRLIPRTCNPSCAMCYYNQKVCEYTNPEAQKLLLNRRLLKLLALIVLEDLGEYHV